MKSIFLLFISLCITMMLQAQVSETIEVTAGNLEKAQPYYAVTNLTLTGTMNYSDFNFINQRMPLLTELDLSEVRIVGTDRFHTSNAIPSGAFYENVHLKSIKLPLSCTKIDSYAFSGCSGLTSIIIPFFVIYIYDDAFSGCISLESITIPPLVAELDVQHIFNNCPSLKTMYVFNTYVHNYEMYSINIVQMPFVELSSNTVYLNSAKDITSTINIDSDSTWTVSSNQTWLTINPASGIGNQKLTIAVDVNSQVTRRTALLTFKIDTVIVNSVVVYQTGITKLINLPADIFLESLLTAEEIELVTSLTLTGVIGLKDFDTMRNMPLLSEIDISGVDILANDGGWNIFPANTIPPYAFSYKGLHYILLPYSFTSIGNFAFYECGGLTSITIPSSVTSIGIYTFSYCSGLTSIFAHSSSPVVLSSNYEIFEGVDKSKCTLFVPYGSKQLYATSNQWEDFYNIVEIPFIEVFKTQLNIAASKGSIAATKIVSDVSWTASSDQSWLSLSQSAGTGEDTLTFTANANLETSPRTATVTVSAEGIESQTITVTQEGGPTALPDLAENSFQIKCYPNPFTNEISIEIQNPNRTEISVDIYNLVGERIKNLAIQMKDEKLDLKWNGTNDLGQKVVPGVYICKVNNQSKQLICLGNSK